MPRYPSPCMHFASLRRREPDKRNQSVQRNPLPPWELRAPSLSHRGINFKFISFSTRASLNPSSSPSQQEISRDFPILHINGSNSSCSPFVVHMGCSLQRLQESLLTMTPLFSEFLNLITIVFSKVRMVRVSSFCPSNHQISPQACLLNLMNVRHRLREHHAPRTFVHVS
jgi:hypothetical protein